MSDDQFQFLGSDSEENQSGLSYQKTFQKARVRWKHDMINDWKQETTLIAGPEHTNFAIGDDIMVNDELLSAQVRHEYSLIPNAENLWGFRTGIDILGGRDSTFIQIPDIETEESIFPFISPALYGEATRDIGDLRAIVGLRSDSHFQKGDVFVLPSHREGLSKALLEAAANGMPLITSDVPGCEECIENNGYVVKVNDSNSLRKAIETFIIDPSIIEKFSNNSMEHIKKNYSLEVVAEAYTKLIN